MKNFSLNTQGNENFYMISSSACCGISIRPLKNKRYTDKKKNRVKIEPFPGLLSVNNN